MTRPVLAVRDLVISKGSRRLVDGVSFTIERGETLGLIGESGSGKSLTALAMMDLLPPELCCDEGSSIEIDGAALPRHDARAMRALRGRKLAMMFQDPMACLNPFMRIGAQICEMLQVRSMARSGRDQRIAELLQEVELPTACAGRFPHELSGGQQQRVMIAMALAGEPDLVIADEPTSALDATIQAEIVALLARLQRDRGMALLIISHDLAVAGALAHQLVVMHRGQIVEAGPTRRVLDAPQHPYTARLLAARRTLTGWRNSRTCDGTKIVAEAHELALDYPARTLFGQPFRAVEGVTFQLARGRTLGLIGESGSGKSTLASAVAGLRPPVRGQLSILGQTLAQRGASLPRRLRRRCQMVMQNPYGALNPRLRIAEAMAEPLLLGGEPVRSHPARIGAALEDVGLDASAATRYPHQLSGGQRQRVCIARALLCEPQLLICDEVVSALDATVQMQILTLLRSLQDRLNFAMLFIGHDLDTVRWISDEVMVLHKGRVVDHCPAAELDATKDRHQYTRQLLRASLAPIGPLTG